MPVRGVDAVHEDLGPSCERPYERRGGRNTEEDHAARAARDTTREGAAGAVLELDFEASGCDMQKPPQVLGAVVNDDPLRTDTSPQEAAVADKGDEIMIEDELLMIPPRLFAPNPDAPGIGPTRRILQLVQREEQGQRLFGVGLIQVLREGEGFAGTTSVELVEFFEDRGRLGARIFPRAGV